MFQMNPDREHLSCYEYREGRPALFGHYPPPPRRIYWPEEQPVREFGIAHLETRENALHTYSPKTLRFPVQPDYTIAISAGW